MKPVVLCILDGVGYREEKDGNAFLMANTPNYDTLWNKYPHSLLEASGTLVGIPEGQMGNSEVGHMNIGAGRIVRQPLELINEQIRSGEFYTDEEILEVTDHVKKNNSKLHIIGLLSDGGVHSHINHVFALLEVAKQQGIEKVYIHVLTDGRDTEPNIALKYLDMLNDKIEELNLGVISSVAGRYYTMDRDNKWDRVEKGYNVIVKNIGPKYNNYKDVIEANYKKEIYDEFIEPSIIDSNGMIEDNDGIMIANFRSDRLRQIGLALTDKNFDKFDSVKLSNIKMITMFPINSKVKTEPAFEIKEIKEDLGEYLQELGIRQLRIAETEKYSHVTFFFDGAEETSFNKCDRILIPSPKVATYDLKPEMSAYEITDKLLPILGNYEVVILNYANGDMVGHTGKLNAAIKACETLDKCVKRLYDKVEELNGTLIITADHGNCDEMFGEHRTTHTTNPVPFIICKEGLEVNNGKLGDIAPTMLKLMDIDIPKEMTGDILIK